MKRFTLIVLVVVLFGIFSIEVFPGEVPGEEKSFTEKYWELRKEVQDELNKLESSTTKLLTCIESIFKIDRTPLIRLQKNIEEMRRALDTIDQRLKEIEADYVPSEGTAVKGVEGDEYAFLGREWKVIEVDPGRPGLAGRKWIGRWTRRPNSATFDATWTLNGIDIGSATITFISLGPETNKITLQRGGGYYTGILAPGGTSVTSGKATWYENQDTWYWHAEIIH